MKKTSVWQRLILAGTALVFVIVGSSGIAKADIIDKCPNGAVSITLPATLLISFSEQFEQCIVTITNASFGAFKGELVLRDDPVATATSDFVIFQDNAMGQATICFVSDGASNPCREVLPVLRPTVCSGKILPDGSCLESATENTLIAKNFKFCEKVFRIGMVSDAESAPQSDIIFIFPTTPGPILLIPLD